MLRSPVSSMLHNFVLVHFVRAGLLFDVVDTPRVTFRALVMTFDNIFLLLYAH